MFLVRRIALIEKALIFDYNILKNIEYHGDKWYNIVGTNLLICNLLFLANGVEAIESNKMLYLYKSIYLYAGRRIQLGRAKRKAKAIC